MSSALIVGGDRIDGIRQVLNSFGVDEIHHWPGRKAGDSNKVIPQDTRLIVLVTNWVGHSFSAKVKRKAAKRGVPIVYAINGPGNLRSRLEKLPDSVLEEDCSREAQPYSIH